MSTTTLPRPPRLPRWAKVTLGVLAVALLVAGAAAAWFVSTLLGLVQDVATDGRVQPGDARVVAAREQAERDLSDVLDDLVRDRPEQVLARTSVSACERGQDNWKVKDDYDLYCGQGDGVLLRAEPGRLRDDALALHEQLLAQGWTPSPSPRDRDTGLRGLPAALEAEPQTPPGSATGARYLRGTTELVVVRVEPGDDVFFGHPYSTAQWDVPRRSDVDTAGLGTTVPEGSYGLALALSAEYFRE